MHQQYNYDYHGGKVYDTTRYNPMTGRFESLPNPRYNSNINIPTSYIHSQTSLPPAPSQSTLNYPRGMGGGGDYRNPINQGNNMSPRTVIDKPRSPPPPTTTTTTNSPFQDPYGGLFQTAPGATSISSVAIDNYFNYDSNTTVIKPLSPTVTPTVTPTNQYKQDNFFSSLYDNHPYDNNSNTNNNTNNYTNNSSNNNNSYNSRINMNTNTSTNTNALYSNNNNNTHRSYSPTNNSSLYATTATTAATTTASSTLTYNTIINTSSSNNISGLYNTTNTTNTNNNTSNNTNTNNNMMTNMMSRSTSGGIIADPYTSRSRTPPVHSSSSEDSNNNSIDNKNANTFGNSLYNKPIAPPSSLTNSTTTTSTAPVNSATAPPPGLSHLAYLSTPIMMTNITASNTTSYIPLKRGIIHFGSECKPNSNVGASAW